MGPIGPHGPMGPPWVLGAQWAPRPGPESVARADFGARARAWGPSAQPEGLIIKPAGLMNNFEYIFSVILVISHYVAVDCL